VLGMRQKGNLKATKGSIVHKILELLAIIKQQEQSTDRTNWILEDGNIGKLKIYKKNLLKPTTLSDEEIQRINSTRINKWNYKDPCQLQSRHIRFGVELVEDIIEKVYTYYKENTDHDWKPVDFKDITNWVWMVLDYKGGMFDPRRRHIVEPEIHFDFVLPEKWAHYKFKVGKEKFEGQLRLKGTIDLVTKIDDDELEIVDYKSGQRLNWTTGEIKDYKALCKDTQLMIYYYAAKKLFPDYNIMMTIFFIRDGGPFTICFDSDTIIQTENMLREKFNEIRDNTVPKPVDPYRKCFKCTKICDYYKMESPNPKLNMCEFIEKSIKEVGIDQVTNLYSDKTFNTYQNPGEI